MKIDGLDDEHRHSVNKGRQQDNIMKKKSKHLLLSTLVLARQGEQETPQFLCRVPWPDHVMLGRISEQGFDEMTRQKCSVRFVSRTSLVPQTCGPARLGPPLQLVQ